MYDNYLKLTVLIASFMFVTGFISLMVLSVTKVLPAQKGLNFEQATCRVTHSEISCGTSNYSDGVRRESKDVETSPCLKVYVLCGDDKFINKNRNVSNDKQIGYLLRKDVYHLNDKVKLTRISYPCILQYQRIHDNLDLQTFISNNFLSQARSRFGWNFYCAQGLNCPVPACSCQIVVHCA